MRDDYLYANVYEQVVLIKTGCFYGSLSEFIDAVNASERSEQQKQMYIAAAQLMSTQLLYAQDK